MEIYSKYLDLDIWLSVEYGIKDNGFNAQAKEEILKGLSNS